MLKLVVRVPRAVRVAAVSLLAAFALWLPAFRSLQSTGFSDWPFFHQMWEVGYVALTRYGEWPLWDPYRCGGISIFGNPQSQHLSPLYWLSLLAGPTLGSKLFIVMHAAAGFAGMYVYAGGQLGFAAMGAALASLAWCASGFFAWHGASGHSAFLPFYFTPWILLAWRKVAVDPRQCTAVAALFTLALLEGGVYPFAYLVLHLAFDGCTRLIARRQHWRAVIAGGLCAGVLAALMGAVRWLPTIAELRRHSRTVQSADGVNLREIWDMLTLREHPWRFPPHPFAWAEYGSYVGYAVVAMAVIGTGVLLKRRFYWTLAGLVFFGALMMGDRGAWSPWELVHRLPIYDSLRVPSRFVVFFTFYLALLAGAAVDAASRLSAIATGAWYKRALWALPVLAVLFVAVDLFAVNGKIIDRWDKPPIEEGFVSPSFYLSNQRNDSVWYASLPRMNLGTQHCYEAMNFTVAQGLWWGDEPQARVAAAQGKVRAFGRTTSRAWAEVTLRTPGEVVFNQNYAPGWRSSVGTARADSRGRLVVDAPAGTRRIEVVFRPATLWPAVGLSVLGCLLAWWWTRVARREPLARWWRG